MSITLEMPVVILAGGLGTRLASETEYRPKPLVKVGHQPILWHIMKIYSFHGFKNFIICLGYKGEMIREYFFHYRLNTGDVLLDAGAERFTPLRSHQDEIDWRLILADTGKDSMTGGRIARIKDYIGSDEFLVSYGDGLADVDIGAVVAAHRAQGRIGTVTGVHPTSRFGELRLEGNLVTSFDEKQATDGWINGGFFVFNRKIFDYLEGDASVLEQAPLRRLAAEGQLGVYHHPGFWQCMDTAREVQLLNDLWNSGRPPWRIWS
jgi:glucose-1-phosphate cytidylyltransferase